MELVVKTPDEKDPLSVQHRMGKALVGTAAGFLATVLVEGLYDHILDRKNKKPSTD